MNYPRILNQICPVYFAGFESDTFRLQKNGWQLSVEQMYDRCAIRLAMKHEGARIFAITHTIDMYQYMQTNFTRGKLAGLSMADPPMIFNVAAIGNDIRFQIMPTGPVSFKAFDATPQYTEAPLVNFEDAVPFRPLNNEAPEIILADKNVAELMEMALRMQDPKQREIREKRRKEAWRTGEGEVMRPGYNPSKDIMAQIISISA